MVKVIGPPYLSAGESIVEFLEHGVLSTFTATPAADAEPLEDDDGWDDEFEDDDDLGADDVDDDDDDDDVDDDDVDDDVDDEDDVIWLG